MLNANIENMEQEIEYLKNNNGMKGLSYDGISTSPTNEIKSSTESIALSNIEAIDYLERMILKAKMDIEKVDRVLEVLEERERIIIKEWYINNKYWYQITPLVFTEERRCRTIKTNAIKKMIVGIYGDK